MSMPKSLQVEQARIANDAGKNMAWRCASIFFAVVLSGKIAEKAASQCNAKQ